MRLILAVPCIVYGEGQGYGNRISIQTTAIVKAARHVGAVYDVNATDARWPVCNIHDNTSLYIELLRSILAGINPGHGKDGYYLASSGRVAWIDIYTAIAKALASRQVVDSSEVKKADNKALAKMAEGLGCPKEQVAVQTGGT